MYLTINILVFDEVEHDSDNYQGQGLFINFFSAAAN